VKSGGVNPRKLEDPSAKKLEKEKKLKEQKELSLIFKPVQTQKIDKGIGSVNLQRNDGHICHVYK